MVENLVNLVNFLLIEGQSKLNANKDLFIYEFPQ